MLRSIIRLALGIAIVVALAAGITWLMLDGMVGRGIEDGAERALGVETRVEGARVRLRRGELEVDSLNIANPPGFAGEHLLKTGRVYLHVQAWSLLTGTIQSRRLEVDDVELLVERRLTGSNISVVLGNLEEFRRRPEAEKARGKNVRIERAVFRNVTAEFRMGSGLLDIRPVRVRVPEIVLDDLGGEQGLSTAQLMEQLLPVLLEAVLEQAGGRLPEDFLRPIRSGLEMVRPAARR